MVLTIVAERRNSPSQGRPSTSNCTVCVKLPSATAAIARVTSVVGGRKSSTSVLTDISISPQAALGKSNRMRSRVLPSLPTAFPTRFNSLAICWLAVTISLNVSAIFPARPVQFPGSRTEKSPSRMTCRLDRITLRSAYETSTRTSPCPLVFASGTPSVGVFAAPIGGTDLFMLHFRTTGSTAYTIPATIPAIVHFYLYSMQMDVSHSPGHSLGFGPHLDVASQFLRELVLIPQNDPHPSTAITVFSS